MEKEQNETVLDIDAGRFEAGGEMYRMQVVAELSDQLEYVTNRTKAIILPRTFARSLQIIGCTIIPVNISRLYLSKESFAAGTLNTLMSHAIHSSLRKIFEYFGRAWNEAALTEGVIRIHAVNAGDIIPGLGAELGLSSLECMEGKPLTVMKDDPELKAELVSDEESFQDFSLFHLATLFKLWFIGLLAAFVLFILEILYQYCKRLVHLHFLLL